MRKGKGAIVNNIIIGIIVDAGVKPPSAILQIPQELRVKYVRFSRTGSL